MKVEITEADIREMDISEEDMEQLLAELKKAEDERNARLDQLGLSVAGLRAEAINGRMSSGIETEWLEDEEYYAGIDDVNRNESGAWSSKPPGRSIASNEGSGSNIFLNITGQYVDSAAASIGDMLMPTDENVFALSATPVPEFIPISKGKIPENIKAQILEESGGDPEQAAATEKAMIKQSQAVIEEANRTALAAQTRIEDWHVEGQFTKEVRAVIEDAARIGSGVLKGPYPKMSRHAAFKGGEMVIEEKIAPRSRAINPWNFYPDPGCGESIHDGNYVFERDYISAKQLKKFSEANGYIKSQIDIVLAEGPSVANEVAPKNVDIHSDSEARSKQFEIWYYYGEIKKEDMEAAGCECEEDITDAHLVMVNNRVIKAGQNILDDGEFPYDVMVWKRRAETPWGTGVARLIRTPQRIIKAATRNMMDNAGLAGGPMWAYKAGIIEPIDGVHELAPRKGWVANEDADEIDISRAFAFFKMDMMMSELQNIIMLGLKFAEEVTGLPMILQGNMGASAPDTLGQTQILNNNASVVRRRIARQFDDLITEPHIRRYYKYLLQYGESDKEKGEFVIDAKGSSNLVERSIQKQQILEMGRLVQNPIYGIDPKKWAKEYLRSEKFDPEQFAFDDEQWEKIIQNIGRPPEDPRMQVAQMNAQVKQQMLDMELQQDSAEREKDRQFKLGVEQLEAKFAEEMEVLRQRGVDRNILDKSKVRINEVVMKLKTQKELSGLKQVTAPPTEPVGIAPDGYAYSR